MKIAISTDSGKVCAHFGRAPEFTFVTIENSEIIGKDVLPNPGHTVGSIPKFLSEHGANYIIAGGMGSRAVEFFNQYNIEVITGIEGTIENVTKEFINGTLKGSEAICTPGAGKGYGIDKIHTEVDDEQEHHHH